jgi:hypothetical protein
MSAAVAAAIFIAVLPIRWTALGRVTPNLRQSADGTPARDAWSSGQAVPVYSGPFCPSCLGSHSFQTDVPAPSEAFLRNFRLAFTTALQHN